MNRLLLLLPLACGLLASAAGLSASLQDLVVFTVYYFLLAASWNLLTGFTGQYSFAQAGLAAFGAYLAGGLGVQLGWPVWLCLLVTPIAGFLVGITLGLVALRVRGVQLSLITFAIAGAFGVFLSADADLTGGSMGMQVPTLFGGLRSGLFMLLAGAIVSLYLFFQNTLLDSGFGMKMQAVRDNEDAAHGLGVNVYRTKVLAFAISAAVAAFAGAFYGSYVGVLAPSMVSVSEMGMVVAMAVVGGLGHRYGALTGAIAFQALAYWIRDFGAQYTLLITSGISLLTIIFFREGLLQGFEKLLAQRGAPKQRWQDAPP